MVYILVLIGICFWFHWLTFASSSIDTCKEEIIENASSPELSPDGKSFAYRGTNKDGKVIMIKDGMEIWSEFDVTLYLRYSPDGKSYAYVGQKHWKQTMVKDGVPWKEYEGVSRQVYSPDWESFAYVARQNGKELVVKDGIEEREYDSISDLRYSSFGKSFSYIAKQGTKYLVVKDWVEGKEYDNISSFSLTYSPDWKSFAYVANQWWKSFMVKDEVKIGKEYDILYNLTFSPDWKSFAYQTESQDGKRWVMVKDGVEGKTYNYIGFPTYSPDWKSFAYDGDTGKGYVIIKDGAELRNGYMESKAPVYSPDWKSFAYIAKKKNGKLVVVKDGVEWIEYSHIYYYGLRYSSDWKTFAYPASKDKNWRNQWVMVRNWIESEGRYEGVSRPALSSDWKYLAYVAGKNGKSIMIKNGVEGKERESVSEPIFSLDGRVFVYQADSLIIKQTCWWDSINKVATSTTTNNKIQKISIKVPPNRTSYNVGDLLDLSGLVVTITFSDWTRKDIEYTNLRDFWLSTSIKDGSKLWSNNSRIRISSKGVFVVQKIKVSKHP